jgi:hypothetical protein
MTWPDKLSGKEDSIVPMWTGASGRQIRNGRQKSSLGRQFRLGRNVVAAGWLLTGASERTERERELPDDCCGLVVRASGLRESEGKLPDDCFGLVGACKLLQAAKLKLYCCVRTKTKRSKQRMGLLR